MPFGIWERVGMKISILRTLGKISPVICVLCLLIAARSVGQTEYFGSGVSIVSAAAESQGLQLVQPGETLPFGTYWTVMPDCGGFAVPLPGPPLDTGLPIFAITDTQFLVDGTYGSQQTFTPQAAEAVSNAVVNLISQVQATDANQQLRMMIPGRFTAQSAPMPPDDTNGSPSSFTPSFYIPSYSWTSTYDKYTNFWLTIATTPTNPTVGIVTIESTLPGYYYTILTNLDLNSTNWHEWTTLQATSTNIVAPPINLTLPVYQPLFFRGKIVLPKSTYLTNGLVAYWKMNDASGTNAADSSGNGVNMPLIGSPSWGPGSLILNGINQYGDAGSNALTSLDQHDKTICAWIYKTNLNFSGIVDKSLHYGTAGWGFWDIGTTLAFYVSNVDGYFQDPDDNGVPLNQWEFVTVVSKFTNGVLFYTNGVLCTNFPRTAAEEPSGTAHLQLGNLQIDHPTPSFWFGGYIRDLAAYNRALSYGEIGANFVNSQYPFSTNIAYPDLLYYKMLDYGPSTASTNTFTIHDSSTHGGTTGTYSNTSDTWVTNTAGLANTALHFSGDKGYIETSNSTLFNFTSNLFSINFWVNPYGGSNGYVLMQNGISPNNGWNIALNGDNTITFGTETNGLERAFTSIGGCNDNVYTMVTIVRNSSTNASIYLNGFLSTNGIITSPAPSTNSLRIGSDRIGDYVLDGNIWLMQIWNTNLSDSDVARLYWHQFQGKSWP